MIIICLSYRIYNTLQQKKKIERGTAILPAFKFYGLNNTIFSNSSLHDINSGVILNFFSPACEHCQYMATQYLKLKEQLKSITILMVTEADSSATAKFYNNYQLSQMPNIIVMRDTKFQFPAIFGTGVVPSFFVYKKQKLIKKIIGETKIENLLSE